MSPEAEFGRRLKAMIDAEMLFLPFRRENNSFVVDLAKDTVGILHFSLTTQRSDGRVGVYPTIGVQFEPIESRCEGRSRDGYMSMTISTALGYVTPEKRFLEWLFEPTFDNQSEVRRMISAVKLYGLPFMQSHSSLDQIVNALEKKEFTFNDSRSRRLPIAYLLQGKKDQASAFLNQELSALGEQSDSAAERYREFAKDLLDEIAGKRAVPPR
jgi:hypothetical protein